MKKLNRNDPLPLYLQIREDIRGQIEGGILLPGHHLPFERDLAAEYGVSRITVKHALQDLAKEGLITRIRRKGTFVSFQPQSRPTLALHTKTLAFIIPDIEDVFISEIYRGVAEAARKRGYTIFILSSDREIEKEAENIRALKDQRSDGAIIFPNWGRANAEQIFELKRRQFPFVLVNRYFRDIQTDYVVTDNRAGACEAVEHLIRLGHRRIGCIGWVECTAVEDRLEGYRLALGRNGIPYDEELVTSIFDDGREKYAGFEPASGGYEETKRLLRLGRPPTAVFAVSDRLAIGAMKAIREMGLKIPDDVALVGFDNVRYAADLDLTTVAQPAFETGKEAAQILIRRITERKDSDGAGEKFHQVVLPTKLIVRGSCGGCKSQADPRMTSSQNGDEGGKKSPVSS